MSIIGRFWVSTEALSASLFVAAIVFAGPASAQEWEVVASSGIVKFVYVAPEGIKDRRFMAQVLHAMSRKTPGMLMAMFYDSKKYTPRGFPMTDTQMLHYKARYNRNPNQGHEEFVWVKVVNPKSSPPELKEVKDSIRPSLAD